MFRSISTRRNNRQYEQLFNESNGLSSSEPKMLRSTTLPANFFGDHSLKFVIQPISSAKSDPVAKQVKKVSKVHPFFSLFGRKKKATAKPEFSRYMQYLKEGGVWDANKDKPVIY